MCKVSRAGVNIIMVTQSLQDIIPEINRAVMLKKGRLFKDGPKEKILNAVNISSFFGIFLEIAEKDG